MTETELRPYTPGKVPGMAHGYALAAADGHSPAPSLPPHPGQSPTTSSATFRDVGDQQQIANPSGGAASTITDMLSFARALTTHRLLSARLTTTVLAGKVDARRPGGPAREQYGYGFDDQRIDGVRVVGHNGGTPGYEGQLDIYPDKGYTVILLTNQDGVLVPAIQRSEHILAA